MAKSTRSNALNNAFFASLVGSGIGAFLYVLAWNFFCATPEFGVMALFASEHPPTGLLKYQLVLSMICGGIVGWKFSRFKRQEYPETNGWAAFLFALIFTCIWIPQGFDVTDEGTRLTQSWFLEDDYWRQYLGLKWGGHYIYGYWLHIFDSPSLIWARFGFALVTAGVVGLSVRIVEFYKTGFRVFLTGCLATIVLNIFVAQTVNYNNLPVLMVLASIWCNLSANKKNSTPKLIFSGLLLALSVFIKFPFVIALALPVFWLIEGVIEKRSGPFPKFLMTGIGVVIGLGLGGLLLNHHGLLGRYLEVIDQVIFKGFFNGESENLALHRHDRAYITNRYTTDFLNVLKLSATVFPTLIISMALAGWKRLPFIARILAFFGAYLILDGLFYQFRWFHSMIAIVLNAALIIAVFQLIFKQKPWLILISLGLMILSFLGTNNGIVNMVMSGGIALLLVATLSIGFREWNFGKINFDARPAILAIVVLLAYRGVELNHKSTYRDAPKSKLVAELDHPSLCCIYTTTIRAEKVNALLNSDVLKGDSSANLATVNYVPIFHYLLDRKPVRIEESDLVLYSRTNSKHPKWPEVEDAYTSYDSAAFFHVNRLMEQDSSVVIFDNGTYLLIDPKWN